MKSVEKRLASRENVEVGASIYICEMRPRPQALLHPLDYQQGRSREAVWGKESNGGRHSAARAVDCMCTSRWRGL